LVLHRGQRRLDPGARKLDIARTAPLPHPFDAELDRRELLERLVVELAGDPSPLLLFRKQDGDLLTARHGTLGIRRLARAD
jgi:hypothetical protein